MRMINVVVLMGLLFFWATRVVRGAGLVSTAFVRRPRISAKGLSAVDGAAPRAIHRLTLQSDMSDIGMAIMGRHGVVDSAR